MKALDTVSLGNKSLSLELVSFYKLALPLRHSKLQMKGQKLKKLMSTGSIGYKGTVRCKL